ncbi:MAG TPA: alpha/beta fold hydrolase [Acidimicrobiales bacterium]|nr:alpha/beta fold hydrolase [Acidimicrobiales bacterium]
MSTADQSFAVSPEEHRVRLLAGISVNERRVDAAGIPTAVLEGGDGPPVVLLHGPGESAVNWRWTIPELVTTHRVVAPDLPAHGSSGSGAAPLDADRAGAWLRALIERTCPEPPAVVGHVLGGAVAARFAAQHGDRLRRLVLVDSLGLARFRPSVRFALRFLAFTSRPSEHTFERFMHQCAFDLDQLREEMDEEWTSFVAYNLALTRSDGGRDAARLFRRVGLPRIPSRELAAIRVPTTLIWGRHDRALRLGIAQKASDRYGWPLCVIDGAADDPARDQPEVFLRNLRGALSGE